MVIVEKLGWGRRKLKDEKTFLQQLPVLTYFSLAAFISPASWVTAMA
jgi:hypothetical protein